MWLKEMFNWKQTHGSTKYLKLLIIPLPEADISNFYFGFMIWQGNLVDELDLCCEKLPMDAMLP